MNRTSQELHERVMQTLRLNRETLRASEERARGRREEANRSRIVIERARRGLRDAGLLRAH
jgi:hypothetical protein